MTEPLVSIIIPIYNTEKYVARAIESVLVQTYHNFELILVDDGSDDNSGKICECYAKKDNRIIVIHQKNSGVANARNAGLDMAKGELVQFLDSDDEMFEEKTKILVKSMLDNDVDIVFCGITFKGKINKTVNSNEAIYGMSEFLYRAYCDAVFKVLISNSYICILKRSIIVNNNIIFPDNFGVGEDGLFILKYLSCCIKIYVIEEVLYQCYRYELDDRVSIMSHTTKDIYIYYITYFEELLKIIEHELSENEKNIISGYFFDRLIPSLIILVIYSDSSLKDLIKELKDIINAEVVHQASLRYKRTNLEHSKWIPVFIKMKFTRLLYYSLKARSKKYVTVYGKNKYVNSVYWKKNSNKPV